MSKLENNIGWCDCTGNMVIGCTKVAPECKLCYALNDTPARVLRKRGIETWGPKGVRHPVKALELNAPRWNKRCICDRCHETEPVAKLGGNCENLFVDEQDRAHFGRQCHGKLRRIRVFGDSNSDWLDDAWPVERLATLLRLIHETPNLDWQLLTKRPGNWSWRMLQALGELSNAEHAVAACESEDEQDRITAVWEMGGNWANGTPPANVWLGVSAGADLAGALAIPAAVHFLSAEPLLGPLDIGPFLVPPEYQKHNLGARFDWVIVGGESGRETDQPRACAIEWIADLASAVRVESVPLYVKQLGANATWEGTALEPWPGDPARGDISRFPVHLQFREFRDGLNAEAAEARRRKG